MIPRRTIGRRRVRPTGLAVQFVGKLTPPLSMRAAWGAPGAPHAIVPSGDVLYMQPQPGGRRHPELSVAGWRCFGGKMVRAADMPRKPTKRGSHASRGGGGSGGGGHGGGQGGAQASAAAPNAQLCVPNAQPQEQSAPAGSDASAMPPPPAPGHSSLPLGALGGPIAGAWASSSIAQQHGSMDTEMAAVDVQAAAQAPPMEASAAQHAQEEGEWRDLSARFTQQWQARGALLEPEADPTARAAKFLQQAMTEIGLVASEPRSTRLATLRAMIVTGQATCEALARALRERRAGARAAWERQRGARADREGRGDVPHTGGDERDRSRDGGDGGSSADGSVHHFPVDD